MRERFQRQPLHLDRNHCYRYWNRSMGLFAGTKWDIQPTCESCGNVQSDCRCPPQPPVQQWLAPEKQTARIRTEKRKAKRVVTVVSGLSAQESDLAGLLTRLKAACGAGGSREDDDLVLQGDHVARVSKLLQEMGYRIRG